LLRVIQNNEFERVGGNETIRSDFRLITATNHDLDQRVREKKFRADLYYRLNVFPIYVPSLRERKEDIPLLTYHFIRKYCQKLGIPLKKISSGEMSKLIRYDWPGNVRELEHAIERGVILSPNSAFKTPELGIRLNSFEMKRESHTLAENERNHILWALEQRGWKVRGPGGVAEFLDIHPSTLAARMKKLGIRRPTKSAGASDSRAGFHRIR
jgi:formate hydrogenlyase transcriptional activator